MEMPNIKTTVKINNCVFEIYAYKKLSYAECKSEIRNWILQTMLWSSIFVTIVAKKIHWIVAWILPESPGKE